MGTYKIKNFMLTNENFYFFILKRSIYLYIRGAFNKYPDKI